MEEGSVELQCKWRMYHMCCAAPLLRSAAVHVPCMHLHITDVTSELPVVYTVAFNVNVTHGVWQFYVYVQETSAGLLGLRFLLSMSIGFLCAHIIEIVCQNQSKPVKTPKERTPDVRLPPLRKTAVQKLRMCHFS